MDDADAPYYPPARNLGPGARWQRMKETWAAPAAQPPDDPEAGDAEDVALLERAAEQPERRPRPGRRWASRSSATAAKTDRRAWWVWVALLVGAVLAVLLVVALVLLLVRPSKESRAHTRSASAWAAVAASTHHTIHVHVPMAEDAHSAMLQLDIDIVEAVLGRPVQAQPDVQAVRSSSKRLTLLYDRSWDPPLVPTQQVFFAANTSDHPLLVDVQAVAARDVYVSFVPYKQHYYAATVHARLLALEPAQQDMRDLKVQLEVAARTSTHGGPVPLGADPRAPQP